MHFRHARSTDVLLKATDGGIAQHTPAWYADNDLHSGVQKEGVDTDLSLRSSERSVRGILCLVASVHLHLDASLGRNYASASKYVHKPKKDGVSIGLLSARTRFRYALRTCTGDYVWLEF